MPTKIFFSISSISLILEKFKKTFLRFPVCVFLILGFSFLLFMNIHNAGITIAYQLWLFFIIGTIICISVALLLEDFDNHLFKKHIMVGVVALLWGVYCFLLPDNSKNLNTPKIVELIVIGIVAFLSMFFGSFLKKNNDKTFWNFTMLMYDKLTLSIIFSVVIFIGLAVALFAIYQLFGSLNDNAILYLAVLCFVLFMPLYFLSNIPNKNLIERENIYDNKFLRILAMYLLIPIAMIYIAILYVYLFKILVNWELPRGMVSWLTSALGFLGLIIVMLLYPVRMIEKNKVAELFTRYIGLIIMPLLILMTIGIIRRITDYGITVNRGYILLLNLWFYGIYIYLFIKKSQHIKWIFISISAIALFFSIGFWSVSGITKQIITADVKKLLNYSTIPISDNALFGQMDRWEEKKVRDKLEYLFRTFGHEAVQQFFIIDIQNISGGVAYILGEINHTIINPPEKSTLNTSTSERLTATTTTTRHFSYSGNFDNNMWLIEKYNTFIYIKYSNSGNYTSENIRLSLISGNQLTIRIVSENRQIIIPMKNRTIEYIYNDLYPQTNDKIIFEGDDYIFIINEFRGYYSEGSDYLRLNTFDGFLFYNISK